MATVLKILEPQEVKAFERAPKFNHNERNAFFQINDEVRSYYENLRTDTSRLNFILQYGYFRARRRFFTLDSFHAKDAKEIILSYQLSSFRNLKTKKSLQQAIEASSEGISTKHRKAILQLTKIEPFSSKHLEELVQFFRLRKDTLIQPIQLFELANQYLWSNKISIPAFYQLESVISKEYYARLDNLLQTIGDELTDKELTHINSLAEKSGIHYRLIQELKSIDQSMSVRSYVANAKQLKELSEYFFRYDKILDKMQLNRETVIYFSSSLSRMQSGQFLKLKDRRERALCILCFTRDQFYRRQDYALDSFRKAFQSIKNNAIKLANEETLALHQAHLKDTKSVTGTLENVISALETLLTILKDPSISESQKLIRAQNTVSAIVGKSPKTQPKIHRLNQVFENVAKETALFNAMEALSIKAQLKLSELVKSLYFDFTDTPKVLKQAIINFGKDRKPITGFLSSKEREAVDSGKSFRISLYKILLFEHIIKAYRKGRLHLQYSYRHISVERMFIDKMTWKRDKKMIKSAHGLNKYDNPESTMRTLGDRICRKYHRINEKLLSNEYRYLKPRPYAMPYSRPSIKTPAVERIDSKFISGQLSRDGRITIIDLLRDIEAHTPFLHTQRHGKQVQTSKDLDREVAIAALMAYGCNIGPNQMREQSKGIDLGKLKNYCDQRLNPDNLKKANEILSAAIKEQRLAKIFTIEEGKIHSSSDGRKVAVATDSILANHSYKYFRASQGVVVYGFVDEDGSLFQSDVISSKVREAPYMIDGLAHNVNLDNRIHATDTHGYTEPVSAIAYLMGFTFAPRIRDIHHARIYSMENPQVYRKHHYQIYPNRKINQKLIIDEWDNILRFVATIKTGKATAAQLFSRLNSYTGDHPTYAALKEFGRLVKTNFILDFYDDVKYRQRLQKILNLGEHANRFQKAVFFDRESTFQVGSYEEMQTYSLARNVIQNAIVLWNYCTLTQRAKALRNNELELDFKHELELGSVITWKHVIFNGIYNFKEKRLGRPRFDRLVLSEYRFPDE